MKKIAILGAGVMGSAVAWPLSDNGYQVNLIGTHLDHDIIQSCKQDRFHPRLNRKIPENVMPYFVEELDKALDGAVFIVSGVNSKGVRWIGKTLAPFLRAGDRIIGITKGMEATAAGELVILPEIMRQEFPKSIRDKISIAAVGGPCIAGELAGRRQSCVYFGARELETVQDIKKYFQTDYYHVWTTNDVEALEIAVAMKNAYALGVGIAAGVLEVSGGVDTAGACMHNLTAAFFARAAKEIHYMLTAHHVNPEFAYSLPGVGDMYVTSTGGRSVRLGKLLGAGKTYSQALEKMEGETLEAAMIIQQVGKALPAMYENATLTKGKLPLMDLLVDVVVHGKSVKIDLDAFFEDVII